MRGVVVRARASVRVSYSNHQPATRVGVGIGRQFKLWVHLIAVEDMGGYWDLLMSTFLQSQNHTQYLLSAAARTSCKVYILLQCNVPVHWHRSFFGNLEKSRLHFDRSNAQQLPLSQRCTASPQWTLLDWGRLLLSCGTVVLTALPRWRRVRLRLVLASASG